RGRSRALPLLAGKDHEAGLLPRVESGRSPPGRRALCTRTGGLRGRGFCCGRTEALRMNLNHLPFLETLRRPLSLYTFVLSAALGLAGVTAPRGKHTSLILAAFVAGMTVVGMFIGHGVGSLLGRFAGYTAAVVIGIAGFLALRSGQGEDKEEQRLKLLAHARGLAIIDLGISISIDELAVGVSLGLLQVPVVLAIIFLGAQAFAAAQLGLWLGGRLDEALQEGAARIAGLIIIARAIAPVALKGEGHEL